MTFNAIYFIPNIIHRLDSLNDTSKAITVLETEVEWIERLSTVKPNNNMID